MRRSLFALGLLCLPALAPAGELTFTPASLYVDNGAHSAEVLVTYRPGTNIRDMHVDLRLNLDRLGWTEAQPVPAASPDHLTWCEVWGGNARAVVSSSSSAALPAGSSIPLCRLRVRPHAHTPRGRYGIVASYFTEFRTDALYPVYTPTTGVPVVVP